ncbi:MAG: hypothetical protein U0871_15620 [Gemmataceae bacterium]
MLKSYVGLASARGLEALTPDHHLARQALATRTRGRRSVCCWAVLPDDSAAAIDEQLAAGDTRAALFLLEATAFGVGPILPSDLACG